MRVMLINLHVVGLLGNTMLGRWGVRWLAGAVFSGFLLAKYFVQCGTR